MDPLQNTKPKINEPKIPKTKVFDQNLNLCKKAKFKILDGHEQKIKKTVITNICETKFSVT